MSKHNLELLAEAARLLNHSSANWSLSEEARQRFSSPTKQRQRFVPPTMSMLLPRSPLTRHTRIFRRDSVTAVSLKILAKGLRFAAGVRKTRFWMSCRSMRTSLASPNIWYKPALDSAVIHELEPGLRVRVVTSVYFCATKLEAFAGRGKNDYQSSHDL